MLEAESTSQETRDLILATADALLRRFGYARTTVSEIARLWYVHQKQARFDIINAVGKHT